MRTDKDKEGKAMHLQKNYLIVTLLLLGVFFFAAGSAHAQAKRPNILVIFGDDVGQANISTFTKNCADIGG